MDEKFVKKGIVGIGNINWWHRIHLSEGVTEGMCHHGPDDDHSWVHTRFGMPKDCTGLSVIDTGSWNGFFSFKAEELGSTEVVATDTDFASGGNWAGNDGFLYAREKLNSKVCWYELNIENKEQVEDFREYDLVLCYGVLYHLRSPLLAVENLMKLVKPGGTILVETAISTNIQEYAALEYRPGHEDDPTNFFYPNVSWVYEAFMENGASSVDVIYNDGTRATFRVGA